ncbi:olfactory receptor 1052-like [Tachyglossus aculeatus]|uniref:olfactory receptor 1052-like n=1 Tax=Tachyglossus aculeatus TaxID=9261 RepID=UPI0018F37595|nr:olfactory receptor 1052-like [Tachyglossus aculeatus]
MAGSNNTSVIEFLLVGLTDRPELQMPLFALFLVIYLITMIGNVCMILLIQIDVTLHTPMYFFLCNLALCDICYSTLLATKMLINFLLEHKASSFICCVFQSFFFAIYITTEGLLLAIMAYDHSTAIVNPLLYTAIMIPKICLQLVLACYLGGLAHLLTQTIGLLSFNFCGPSVINHFFCDIPPLLKLSCSDSHTNELLLLTFSGAIAAITLIITVISYVQIVTTILRIGSVKGRYKTFSTCTSHLTAVILFYGSLSFSYIQPSSQYSLEQEKVSAVVYTLVIPMLNLLIYSLRNKDVKEALKRSIKWKNCHQ